MSRLVDILLIAAAVYFLFPTVFRRLRKSKNEQRNVNIESNDKQKSSGKYRGEYIDYEEVK